MIANILIIAVVAVLCRLCIKSLFGNRKKGCSSGCGGNCAGCHGCGTSQNVK